MNRASKTTEFRFAKMRVRVAPFVLGAALVMGGSATASWANEKTRPDALLQIDLNRMAVIERIVNDWRNELPKKQLDSFREKLRGLRADQLLAANTSGTLDGVL